MTNIKTLTKEINYQAKKDISSITQYKECLEKFSKGFDETVSLSTQVPIFLDTNILLRYYSISFTAREKLFSFIQENKARIVITPQVQFELIRNREDVIQRFFEQVTTRIPKDFSSDVVNKMKSFLDNHKIVLKDYPFVEEGIEQHQAQLESILNKLNETVEANRKELTNLIVNDKLLDLLSSCTLHEGLTLEETDLVKKTFDVLAKSVGAEGVDSLLNKPNAVFPGMGDIKTKPDDPYGDFIIFHEMMKFMLNKKSDVVFLTFDNTKGDWMSKSRAPYLHYAQVMYANTGQIIYIVDAERTLGNLLNVDIKSLVKTEVSERSDPSITAVAIKEVFETHPAFSGASQGSVSPFLITELEANGYDTVAKLVQALDAALEGIKKYRKTKGARLNTVGILRTCLKMISNEYIQISKYDGSLTVYGANDLKAYRGYL